MSSPTEAVHPKAARLGPGDTRGLLRLMAAEDARALAAVRRELPRIARVAAAVAEALGRGGRLVYLGAGTSGRLGALDAAECPPTFGTRPGAVLALMAGGRRAFSRAVEGAEDDAHAGAAAVARAKVRPADVVLGISASGRARWVQAGLAEAKRRGATTVLLTCNPAAARRAGTTFTLCPATGPEVVAGSTRLKAATATRTVLAMISTGAMARLGRVHRGRMVALVATNQKLFERAARTLARLRRLSLPEARARLRRAKGRLADALAR